MKAKYRSESSIRELKGSLVTREDDLTRKQAELQTITRDRAHWEVGFIIDGVGTFPCKRILIRTFHRKKVGFY